MMADSNQIKVFCKEGRSCFHVRVQPKAAKNEIVGSYGSALKIRLIAPPVGNRANRLLLSFLSETLDLDKDRISILSGLRSRTKTVGIQGLSEAKLIDRLAQYLV
ncbi:MAG: DUF167 domain-containing protein [bacterium]